MLKDPVCPVCRSSEWEALAERIYSRQQAARASRHVRSRLTILLDLWAGGADTVTLTFKLCRCCGLVTYIPRPTADDLDRKYRYLNDVTPVEPIRHQQKEINIQRSAELLAALEPYLKPAHGQVLDYGGGDGKLMASLLKRGFDCSVIDYVDHVIDGVKHRGRILEDLAANAQFDIVICSHVLEHLAAPTETLMSLAKHLRIDGILFAEVPLEICGRVPAPKEPVTHINYFSEESLRASLEFAGYEVRRCWTATPRHQNGGFRLAVRALAQPSSQRSGIDCSAGARATKRLIDGGRTEMFKCLMRYPRLWRNFPKRIGRKIHGGGSE